MKLPAMHWATNLFCMIHYRLAIIIMVSIQMIKCNGQSEFKPFVDGDGPDDMKDKVLTAFGPNYPRLQRVKRQYDPENVFNKWFPIVPA